MVLFFVGLVFAVLALISCLSAEDGAVRGLPRIAWVIIILLFPLLGSVVYFLAGRPVKVAAAPDPWRPGSGFPEPQRPRRQVAPDDDPEFLRSIENRRKEDEDLMKRWEDDLRRREEELRNRGDEAPPADA